VRIRSTGGHHVQVDVTFLKLIGNDGKVERSHRTDKQEFYQLLTHKGDVDLGKKLAQRESFYNYHRPHGVFAGKTPYEALR